MLKEVNAASAKKGEAPQSEAAAEPRKVSNDFKKFQAAYLKQTETKVTKRGVQNMMK